MSRSIETDPAPQRGAPQGTATCVHCLVQSTREPSLEGAPPGLDGTAPVRLLDAGEGLWLVVSSASLEHYDAPAIEAGLRDMDWVSRHALRHERTVAHFLELGALIPMKLFTLYLGDDRAKADVAQRRAQIDGVLEAVRDAREWGLRILVAQAAPEPPAAQRQQAAETVQPGTAFLQRKQKARSAALAAPAEAQARAQEVFRRLEGLAVRATRRERLPEAAGSRLVLDALFLVHTGSAEAFCGAFREAALEYAHSGLELALSGPWAAYNFVEPSE